MPEEDSYHTYTDYWPCKPVAHRICWIVPALMLVVVLVLAGVVYLGG